MKSDKFKLIQQLMEELQEEMSYSKDDLEERLGRKKSPVGEVKAIAIQENPGVMEINEGKEMDVKKIKEPVPSSVGKIMSGAPASVKEIEIEEYDADADPDLGMDEDDRLRRRIKRMRNENK